MPGVVPKNENVTRSTLSPYALERDSVPRFHALDVVLGPVFGTMRSLTYEDTPPKSLAPPATHESPRKAHPHHHLAPDRGMTEGSLVCQEAIEKRVRLHPPSPAPPCPLLPSRDPSFPPTRYLRYTASCGCRLYGRACGFGPWFSPPSAHPSPPPLNRRAFPSKRHPPPAPSAAVLGVGLGSTKGCDQRVAKKKETSST